MPKCFKCEKEIESAVDVGIDLVEDVWISPSDAVLFCGGHNFGSAEFDSMVTGQGVEIIICDDCLIAAKGTDKMREVPIPRG